MRFNDKNGGGCCTLATVPNAEDPCCSPNGHGERARTVVSPRG